MFLLARHLENKGYNVSSDAELKDILNVKKYQNVLNGCGSNYKLLRDCSLKLGMIKPKMHKVGNFKGYYIPLTDILTYCLLFFSHIHVMPLI